MAGFTIRNIAVKGVATTVPRHTESNREVPCIPEKERDLFIRTTGIESRRIAPSGVTAADLSCHAADRLLKKLGWALESIDALIFVSQTPDFLIPGSSMDLQARLGLPKSAMTVDINQGCAGYPYGLSVLSSLLAAGGMKRGLLLVGDTITRHISPKDKSTYPIFSDAGTATALEFSTGAAMHFLLGTDGSGSEVIQTPGGGSRHPFHESALEEKEYGPGIIRRETDMGMNGLDVFQFAIREVPANIRELLSASSLEPSEIDYFVLHQANRLMNETIRKRLRLEPEQVPYSIHKYGNTSCASIPVTISSELKSARKVMLTGFGVGLSWGSVILDLSDAVIDGVEEMG